MGKVLTPPCIVCGDRSTVELTNEELIALGEGKLIQAALPERDNEFRELIISGTHGACWDGMFGDIDHE